MHSHVCVYDDKWSVPLLPFVQGLVDRVGIYTGSLESYLSKKDLLFSKVMNILSG